MKKNTLVVFVMMAMMKVVVMVAMATLFSITIINQRLTILINERDTINHDHVIFLLFRNISLSSSLSSSSFTTDATSSISFSYVMRHPTRITFIDIHCRK